jgi:hypothetical protein
MPAPSFISSTQTTNSATTPKTTASIAVQNGDILVASEFMENATSSQLPGTITTASGSTSAWTQRQVVPASATTTQAYVITWTASATATGNITVTFGHTGTTSRMMGVVKVWRNSNGVGASNTNNNGTSTGTPTVSVTTTGANSGLDFSSDDWNAVTGTATFTASSGTPVQDVSDQTQTGAYCVYSSHVLDAGAIGSKSMGMSAPTGQRYVCTVVEVLGTAAVAALPGHIIQASQAIKRAAYW